MIKDVLTQLKQSLLERINKKEYLAVMQGGEVNEETENNFELEMTNLGEVKNKADIAITTKE